MAEKFTPSPVVGELSNEINSDGDCVVVGLVFVYW